MKKFLVYVFSLVTMLACAGGVLGGDGFGYISKPSVILYIYGGTNEQDYLGALNASRYDSESIWNPYGTYGNKYSSKSIWNQYGTYGNKYSSSSPFNEYASNPPVLRDRNGRFYGYFTANKYKPRRANYELIDIICENYERIREDVGKWYDKIF
jgi:hypothetical protein